MKAILKTVDRQFFQLAVLEKNTWVYNKATVFEYLQALGQKRYGDHFKIDPFDEEIVFKLIVYCIKDYTSCQEYKLDPKKGLLISGPVGVGKTCLVNLMPSILPTEPNLITISCRNIAFEYNKKGVEAIEEYANITKVCYDDLGVEAPGRFYGKDCNTMAEVLLTRYEKFIQQKNKPKTTMHTTITTNLNASEIEKRYGERVRSRIREMFNLITFSREARDKRV